MASDYGLNFGFRRSDESMRVAEGRLKTPAADPVLLLGTAVKQDTATPDRLEVAAADEALVTGFSGLLLQEEVWDRSFYEQQIVDSFELGKAKKDRLSVITSGAGVKVWMKNTSRFTVPSASPVPWFAQKIEFSPKSTRWWTSPTTPKARPPRSPSVTSSAGRVPRG